MQQYLRSFVLITLMSALVTANGQALKSDTINVLNYSIVLDMKHLSHQKLYGTADLTITPRMASVESFSLDFRKLTIDSLLLNGTPHAHYHYNDTVLRLLLAAPVTPADTFVLRVVYHGTPLIESYNWGGFHFLADSSLAFNLGVAFKDYPHNYGRVWFPCLDDFIDRATYDVKVRTQGHHRAVAGGVLVDTLQHPDGTITWHWHLNKPVPTYLASVAAGDLTVVHDVYYGIQDTIPISIYVRPADSANAVATFSEVPQMMAIFEERFGPYRWPRVGYTGTTKGAMEHATNIAMPRNLINGTQQFAWLIAHELAHAWFGNLITCASSGDMWINEGWARYAESIYTEGTDGVTMANEQLMELRKKVLNFTHTSASGGDGSWLPLSPVGTDHTYGSTVYDKGALVVHTLRGYLGDSLFFDAVKALTTHFAFQPVSSYQMRDFLTQYTGINLNPFFDAWVFTPGFPHFSIDSVATTPYSGGWNVTVHVKQKITGRSTYADDNKVEIGFYDSDFAKTTHILSFSGATGMETFWLPFEPVLVLMDPRERTAHAATTTTTIIKDEGIHLFTDMFFRLRVNALPDSLLFRVEHAFVNPDPLPHTLDGLTLSPNRYWKLSGVIPPSANLDGLFSYSVGNQYDNALITNNNDSLVVLYRPHAGEKWGSVPFIRSGAPTAGVITVPALQMGEYTLAMWDQDHIGVDRPKETSIKYPSMFYPNPARNKLYVRTRQFETPLYVRIYQANGAFVSRFTLGENSLHQSVDLNDFKPGVYLFVVSTKQGLPIASEWITIISR